MAKNIYLAKNGKITGPITMGDYDNLKLSGQIEQFFWIWHDEMKQWIPLDPPPAPIHSFGDGAKHEPLTAKKSDRSEHKEEPAHPAIAAAQAAAAQVIPIKTQVKFGSMKGIEVLCHDFRNIVQGSINEPTQLGFTLLTEKDSHPPKLGGQGKVILNLLNKDNGEMITVPAEITGVQRTGEAWSYQMRWGELPAHFFK
ncbi:MAG: hypothetical protein KA715_09985 [Xanthomonadaceae bacterium]|nr:hypothetical protein [Xanthomonadaceae bacterium]